MAYIGDEDIQFRWIISQIVKCNLPWLFVRHVAIACSTLVVLDASCRASDVDFRGFSRRPMSPFSDAPAIAIGNGNSDSYSTSCDSRDFAFHRELGPSRVNSVTGSIVPNLGDVSIACWRTIAYYGDV